MKCFTYADQNHTYSDILHIIYCVANYLELRHAVSNSHAPNGKILTFPNFGCRLEFWWKLNLKKKKKKKKKKNIRESNFDQFFFFQLNLPEFQWPLSIFKEIFSKNH